MNRQLSQVALKLWVKFTPWEDEYVSSLEWFWVCAGASKILGPVILRSKTLLDTTQNSPGELTYRGENPTRDCAPFTATHVQSEEWQLTKHSSIYLSFMMGCECGCKVQTPCPSGCQFQSVKTRSPVFFTMVEPISFIKDSPFPCCKFTFKWLNYTTHTQTKLAWPGFQYSLATLHQLNIWPSIFPRPM